MMHVPTQMLYVLLINLAVPEALLVTKLLSHLGQPDNILQTVVK